MLKYSLVKLDFRPIVCYNQTHIGSGKLILFYMLSTILFTIYMSLITVLNYGNYSIANPTAKAVEPIATRQMSLETRYGNTFVNDVFKDNILLTIDYATGKKIDPKNVNWAEMSKPFSYTISLKPGEVFAFHDDVLPEFEGKVAKTTNAHFNSVEGFKSDGYLVGDGVCHLASLLYWVAKDAGLKTEAPTNHNFANIPEVPKEYGVSIYATPGANMSDKVQNLYITNDRDKEIAFVFNYDGKNLKISAVESI